MQCKEFVWTDQECHLSLSLCVCVCLSVCLSMSAVWIVLFVEYLRAVESIVLVRAGSECVMYVGCDVYRTCSLSHSHI